MLKEQFSTWAAEKGFTADVDTYIAALPDKKAEEYKYFPILSRLDSLLGEKIATDNQGGRADLPFGIEGKNILHIHNGAVVTASVDKSAIQIEDNVSQSNGTDPFKQLSEHFPTLQYTYRVEKETDPIWLIFTNDGGADNLIQPAIHFHVAENREAEIIELHQSDDQARFFANVAVDIHCDKASRVKYYKISLDGDQALHVGSTSLYQKKDSVTHCFNFGFSGDMIRNNLNISLEDEHTEANMHGLSLLNGKTRIDNHTVVDHKKPNCLSNEYYKGIFGDKSTGVFNGKIFVRQDAQKTNAYQSNRNLLLSDSATINTKPQLEIWADDVKCSHGATTGQLEEDHLFYLQSRGISRNDARKMLIEAFAREIVEKVANEKVLEILQTGLDKKLS